MGRKAKSNALNRAQQTAERDRKPNPAWWAATKLWALLGIALPLLGIYFSYFALKPSISVIDPVDADNPFSAKFVISNSNVLDLRHVTISLGFKRLQNMRPGKPYCAKLMHMG